jgi:hypothetical protein
VWHPDVLWNMLPRTVFWGNAPTPHGDSMRTYRVVKVPTKFEPRWGVVCTFPNGAAGLLAGLYKSEAEAKAEADRLTREAGASDDSHAS